MLAYVTQRYPFATDVATDGPPEAMVRRQLMPALAALGLIVAGGVVPVALVAYGVCNSVWTLEQSAVIWQLVPTPGSPGADRAR
jgi:YidC/Oxa1 family membrane protein insertase